MRNGFLGWQAVRPFLFSAATMPLAVAFATLLTGCGNGASSLSLQQEQLLPGEFFPGGREKIGERLLEDLAFTKDFRLYAPLNILSYHLTHRFSVSDDTATGTARIQFRLPADGNPYFFLTPTLQSAKLDGKSVGTMRVSDPKGVNTYTALQKELRADEIHELEVTFKLSSAEFNLTSSGGVGFLVSFTDVSNWKFLNRYGVGNFESDQFPLIWDLELVDGPVSHTIFANGEVSVLIKDRKWRVTYPAYYTSSSFFLHFTSEKFTVEKLTYQGQTKAIPIILYSKNSALVATAKAQIVGLFKELEGDYGPYPHDQFIAYLSGTSGGMEYVGATITSVPSLDHELLHSWFARGVMPAEGRSGWFDEAIASWRDYGYARKTPTLSRTPTNLSNYSIFVGNTAKNSYSDGRQLMAEFDMIFKNQGGYKAVLREFHTLYQKKVVTTESYLDFVQSKTTLSLKPYIERYVYGLNKLQSTSELHSHERELTDQLGELSPSDTRSETRPARGKGHPTALTLEEEEALR